jgi:predicted 2-oxoglutarate/Fe(II)-dependent dioxygenase YbiX
MASVLNQLDKILESLSESVQFAAAGELAPVLPGLEVAGVGNIGIPITATAAQRLIEQASQAPYGRGEETLVDTHVRRVWQLEPRQFTLHNSAWAPFVDGIVETVRKEFGIRKNVQHELYKLLIYEQGSFFAPHRDSEKTPGMFATLVVCLPSRHEGGALLVTHDGETKRIEFGGSAAEFNIQYAAFYADCQHEITPVTSGYRVCLVYNLALARQETQPSAPVNSQAVDAVVELLPALFADDSRDKLVIPFKHQYTEAALDPQQLKGADRARMAVLTRAAERLGYQVFVALLTHRQSGSPDYGTIAYSRSRRRYRRFDSSWDDDISGENADAEFEEVFDESRSLDHWLDPQGRKQPFGRLSFKEDELAGDSEKRPYQQQISEATGNEGATMERWYRQAVVVLWPRDRYFRILAAEGPQHAVPALEKLVAGTADPAQDAACRSFATEIIERWQEAKQAWFNRYDWSVSGTENEDDALIADDELDDLAATDAEEDDKTVPAPAPLSSAQQKMFVSTRMLTVLDRIGAGDLAARFVRDMLPNKCSGSEGPILTRLADRFGWQLFAKPLQHFFAQQKPANYASKLATPVQIFADLCCSSPAMTDERRAACAALADEVEHVLERWDRRREQEWYPPEPRTGIVESIFRALAALGDMDRLAQFVGYILAKPQHYDLRAVLIPAVKSLHPALSADAAAQASLDRLLHHCITELRGLTATPIEPPADWSRAAKLDCKCDDCKELTRFLRDPVEKVHRFPRRKELRQHLHGQIDQHHLDLTHATERTGSPQTLVCTKNSASYERKLAQFNVDMQFLKDLEQLAGGARSRPPSAQPRASTKKTSPKKAPVKKRGK